MHAFRLAAAALWLTIVGGCGPRPLPPILEAPISVSEASKCHGLNTNFYYFSDRFGFDDEFSKKTYGGRRDGHFRLRDDHFLYMFGFVGHRDLKRTPAYAKAMVDSDGSKLRLVFYSTDHGTLAQ